MTEQPQVTADAYFAVIPEWVLDAPISAQAVRLYGVLRRYADAQGACYPSRATLANRLRCSTDTVDRALRELRDLGAVQVQARQEANGDRATNLYLVATMPRGGRTAAQGGGRKDAEGVAAPVRHRTIANEPEPGEPPTAPRGAAQVVAAFVDEFTATHGAQPPVQALARIGRDARLMLQREDRPPAQLVAAAQEAARSGHPNLASALTRVLAGGGLSNRQRSLQDATALVQRLAAQESASLWQVEA